MFPYHCLRLVMDECHLNSSILKCWSVLAAIILFSPLPSTSDCIYHELNGNLTYSKWNLSLFTTNFEGILLYATNANESLIIKLHPGNQNGTIALYYTASRTRYTTHCTIEPINHLTVLISLGSGEMILNCKNAMNLTSSVIDENVLHKFPVPKDYYKAPNKTFIWMGNIGPYLGYNNKSFYPLKQQLIGCVEYFYFNNQPIALKNQGNHIFPSCTSQTVTEETENRTARSSRSINVQMYDCSLPGINANRCDQIELPVYKQSNQSYHRYGNYNYNKTIRISLVWKQLYSKDFCLMEIKLRNGTITFTVNNINAICMVMYSTDASTSPRFQLLDRISLDKINKLSIAFGISEFMVKVFNGIRIYKFITDSVGAPIKIDVGKSRNEKVCRTFEGILGFQYDSSDFTRSRNRNMNAAGPSYVPESSPFYLILIGGFSTVMAALFVLYCIFKKKMKRAFKELGKNRTQPRNYELVENICTISSPIRESCDYGKIEDSEYAFIK